jgi:hypothetical protein
MKMDFKDRSEYNYSIYFYSEPNFLLLENSSIIDVNIREKKIDDKISTLEVMYSDVFFDYNIRNIKKKNFLIIIIIHNHTGQFLQQITIHGESLSFGNHPHIDCVNFNFQQMTNNKAWKSIPNDFQKAEEIYKSERLSYIRESRINKILD